MIPENHQQHGAALRRPDCLVVVTRLLLNTVHASGAPARGRGGLGLFGARTWAAKRANMRRMSKMQSVAVATFTAGEREYIRRELDSFFSTLPSVAEGFQLKPGAVGRRPVSQSSRRPRRVCWTAG